MKQTDFSNLKGIRVGHAQNTEAGTGCTVVICEDGATAGVDVRGGAPATRETDLLDPVNLVDKVHAIVLTGGSAFGLDSASGVMRYLEERGTGFDVQVTHVPIVCAAALFDLAVGDHSARPDGEMGYRACLNATASAPDSGCVGAGTGASVGKVLGMDRAMKSGFGCYALQAGDLIVGALVAVNCLGDVVDPSSGKKLAGPLMDDGNTIGDTEGIMTSSRSAEIFPGNTTIGVVVTNALLTKAQAAKLASMTHNGYARTMSPAHTLYDGDTIFAMSCGNVSANLSAVGVLGARAMEKAVLQAVISSESMYGLRCASDIVKR